MSLGSFTVSIILLGHLGDSSRNALQASCNKKTKIEVYERPCLTSIRPLPFLPS